MLRRCFLILVLISLQMACTDSYSIFSTKYTVSFSCNLSDVPFNSINTLGYFLSVRPKSTKDGYKVILPDGTEREYPYTEVESRVFQYGLAGLIIGKPYFGDVVVYAYDLGCPQCDRGSVRLTVDLLGEAKCHRCGTIYKLNNDGVAENGGHPLYRYQTSLNGTFLTVHN